jgi:hypothetical protein
MIFRVGRSGVPSVVVDGSQTHAIVRQAGIKYDKDINTKIRKRYANSCVSVFEQITFPPHCPDDRLLAPTLSSQTERIYVIGTLLSLTIVKTERIK